VTVIKGLYAVSPEAEDSAQLLASVGQVLDNGVSILQYRNKSDNTVKRLRQASLLASLCKSRHVLFLINDDITLARAVEADGVHLGKTDGSVAEARALLGPNAIIGVSCYDDIHLAEQAVRDGASYIAFGAVYPSHTKPHAVAAPLSLFAQAKQLGLPSVAIGGITPENAADVVAAGADAIAVISGLFGAADPAAAARQMAALFD